MKYVKFRGIATVSYFLLTVKSKTIILTVKSKTYFFKNSILKNPIN